MHSLQTEMTGRRNEEERKRGWVYMTEIEMGMAYIFENTSAKKERRE